ncbi:MULTISPECIES: DUF4132 domain-containing protein [unclassified Actinotalea]|uniref:DUF4132 domain-containing protein n=1 Tax=unclassified Actinotalea TaxID=2638618 RepID=UPI0015F3E6D2|nr:MULTISPECIES: DUF4132 domain-containing protein [unclassified Actinotalea]
MTTASLVHRIEQALAAREATDDEVALADRVVELAPADLGRLHVHLETDQVRAAAHPRLTGTLRRHLDDAVYPPAAASAVLRALADGDGPRQTPAGRLTAAAHVLRRATDPVAPDVVAAATALLAVLRAAADAPAPGPERRHRFPWGHGPALALLAGIPGAEDVWPDLDDRLRGTAESSWHAGRLEMVSTLSAEERFLLDRAPQLWVGARPTPVGDGGPRPDDIPAYRAWVRNALEDALERARDVAAGRVPYAPDAAFTGTEAPVVAEAALQALAWDEPWVADLVPPLLEAVSTAPDPAARTVPSQSLAMNLGRAIACAPTPETVQALTRVIPTVRHAGVKKKLTRHLADARRHLALRPAIAFRGDPDLHDPRRTTQLRLLEKGYLTGLHWPAAQWQDAVAPSLGDVAGRLVWRVTSADGRVRSAMPRPGAGTLLWTDADDLEVSVTPDASVALWHPASADDQERGAWRDRIWRERIDQPFRQVFREHYGAIPAADGVVTDFEGYVVDLRLFTAVARGAGWTSDAHDGMTRTEGAVVARVDLPGAYPGARGESVLGALRLRTGRGAGTAWSPDAAEGHVLLSEILRSLDLAVSVAALGLVPDRPARLPHWSDGLALRRDVVARATEGLPDTHLSRTHLHVGRFAIHLRTGRITLDGDEVPLVVTPRPTPTVPWLPYDEKLLARILAAVAQCARGG